MLLLDLAPDIAIVCECAEPERLRLRSKSSWMQGDPVWIGRNPHKGLAVFAFNGYAVRLARVLSSRAALHRAGPCRRARPSATCWPCGRRTPAPAASASTSSGPLRRALARYRSFLGERPAVIAGDLNSNTIWDKPGWRINHSTKVRILEESFGLVSAYHAIRGEAHGAESEPTALLARPHQGRPDLSHRLCLPADRCGSVRCGDLSVGTFETWCGSGLERPCARGCRCRCLVEGRA